MLFCTYLIGRKSRVLITPSMFEDGQIRNLINAVETINQAGLGKLGQVKCCSQNNNTFTWVGQGSKQ